MEQTLQTLLGVSDRGPVLCALRHTVQNNRYVKLLLNDVASELSHCPNLVTLTLLHALQILTLILQVKPAVQCTLGLLEGKSLQIRAVSLSENEPRDVRPA